MRPGIALAATLVGTVLIWVPREFEVPVLAVWNASASAPIGLYRVIHAPPPGRRDRVLVTPQGPVAALLNQRRYVPEGVPLIKTIAAVAPSRVCRDGAAITIDGRHLADARLHDRTGRPLPRWSGCHVLGPDQVFLLTVRAPDSLDGRYFGPTPRSAIRGRLEPIWIPEPAA